MNTVLAQIKTRIKTLQSQIHALQGAVDLIEMACGHEQETAPTAAAAHGNAATPYLDMRPVAAAYALLKSTGRRLTIGEMASIIDGHGGCSTKGRSLRNTLSVCIPATMHRQPECFIRSRGEGDVWVYGAGDIEPRSRPAQSSSDSRVRRVADHLMNQVIDAIKRKGGQRVRCADIEAEFKVHKSTLRSALRQATTSDLLIRHGVHGNHDVSYSVPNPEQLFIDDMLMDEQHPH